MHQVELMLLNLFLEHTPMRVMEDTTTFKLEEMVTIPKRQLELPKMMIPKRLPHHQNAQPLELIPRPQVLLALEQEPLLEDLPKENQEVMMMN